MDAGEVGGSRAVACPRCGRARLLVELRDGEGLVRCVCGHVVDAGYLAEAAYLEQRLAWLRGRIAEGGPAPEPAVAVQYGIWDGHTLAPLAAGSVGRPGQVPGPGGAGVPVPGVGVPGPHVPGPHVPGPHLPGRPGMQATLLALGTLLLVIAAAIFTAVAWPLLGAAGRVALMLGLTAAVAALAVVLRPRVHGTAEALAVLAVALLVIDVAAAPPLGLLPRSWGDLDSGYWSVALLVLWLGSVAAGRRVRLAAWVWLGWAALAGSAVATGVWVAGLLGADPGDYAVGLAVPCVLGVLLLGAPASMAGLARERGPSAVAGLAALGLSGIGLAALALGREAAGGVALTAAVTAVVAGILEHRTVGSSSWSPGRGPAGPAGAPSVIEDEPPPGQRRPGPAPAAPRIVGGPSPWARWLLGSLARGLAGIAVGLLLALPGATALWAAIAAGLAGAAALVAGVRWAGSLIGALVAVPLWLAWLMVAPPSRYVPDAQVWLLERGLAAFLAGVAIGAYAAAWLGRARAAVRWVGWAGAPAALATFAFAVPQGYSDQVEAWSLPAAAFLALSGAITCAGRDAPIGERWGAALAAGLLPSALATWAAPWVWGQSAAAGPHLARLVTVLAVASALAVMGVRARSIGVLLPAGLALLVSALAQVASGLQALPRWVALGLVGLGLLVAGARFEWVRDEGRRARAWARTLD